MKAEIEEEIEKLNASLHNYYQFRNTEAVNRLAMLSLMLGAGAVVTGFFGMNFGRDFAQVFFRAGRRLAGVPLCRRGGGGPGGPRRHGVRTGPCNCKLAGLS